MNTERREKKSEGVSSTKKELSSSLLPHHLEKATNVTSRLKEALGAPKVMPLQPQGVSYAELLFKQNSEKREAEWHRSSIPIDLSKAIIVPKHTKVQYDMARLKLTFEELKEAYRTGGEDPKRIIESHERQIAAVEKLTTIFSPSQIIAREDLTENKVAEASLVIALGGDNHFQYVSRYVKGDTPILGVNSDPKTSRGALLSCNSEELSEFATKLAAGEFALEPWTRLKVCVDKGHCEVALADLFLGESSRQFMSRHVLSVARADGKIEIAPVEQKCSGLLVASGAGSGGWFGSAGRYLGEDLQFSKSARLAKFLLTEPSSIRPTGGHREKLDIATLLPHALGTLREGDKLIVHSLNDSKGIVSADSLVEMDFNRGRKAEIEIDLEPLWVVTFKGSTCNQ